MTDENITQLPVRFKRPMHEGGLSLKVVDSFPSKGQCNHRWFFVESRMVEVCYLIREGEIEVECGNCHVRLDPMWVLRMLAHEESKWRQTSEQYQEEMRRLAERERTKCQHCGKMTRISHR